LQFDEVPSPTAFQRSRSSEDIGAQSSPKYSCKQEELDRLNDVIYKGLRPEPLLPQQTTSKSSVAEAGSAPKPKPGDAKKMAMNPLKTVQSTSSVSTMAPEDFEDGEQHHEGCDRDRGHHQFLGLKSFQHCQVPRSLNLAEQFSKAQLEEPPTTMMIRNIPNRYSQRELIRELETLGFAGSFDFFYAPIDTGTMGNVGYAFVNFVDPAWAEYSKTVLTGYAFKKHQQKARRKIATVSVAHLQGLQANIRHYENAAVNGRNRSKRCGPVILTSIAGAVPMPP